MNIHTLLAKHDIPAGFKLDAGGNLIKVDNIKTDKLRADELVYQFIPEAVRINQELISLKTKLSSAIPAFIKELVEEHGVKKMAKIKGNVELTSFDGHFKLKRSIQDKIQVNANIEAARQLFDQYQDAVTNGVDDAIKKLIARAFGGSGNQISTSRLIDIKNTDIDHPLWKKAVEALEQALEVHDSTAYYLFYYRAENGDYRPISLQFSAVELDEFLYVGTQDKEVAHVE